MPSDIVQQLIEKTFRELEEAAKPAPRSRTSNTSNGYIHLIAWANASLLRHSVRIFTITFPKNEYRLKAQLNDAARSVVANIEEGYGRPTTSEYLTFLGYAEASLVEVKGDIQRCRQDGFLVSLPGSSLLRLGIDLRAWHIALKETTISKPAKGFYGSLEESIPPQNPSNSFKFLYPPVDNLSARLLTYEVFIELINKTSWHLRRLVVSLEDKLARDQKFYQVEQARLRSKLKMR